jgi:hypothetical protein
MASRVPLDLLLWVMRSALYRLIRTAIEMASKVGAFKTVALEIPGTENGGKKTPSGQTVGRPMVCFKKNQKIKFDYKTTLPPPPPQAIRETVSPAAAAAFVVALPPAAAAAQRKLAMKALQTTSSLQSLSLPITMTAAAPMPDRCYEDESPSSRLRRAALF